MIDGYLVNSAGTHSEKVMFLLRHEGRIQPYKNWLRQREEWGQNYEEGKFCDKSVAEVEG